MNENTITNDIIKFAIINDAINNCFLLQYTPSATPSRCYVLVTKKGGYLTQGDLNL